MSRWTGKPSGFGVADALVVLVLASFALSVLYTTSRSVLQSRYRTQSVLECKRLVQDVVEGLKTPEDLFRVQIQTGSEIRSGRCRLQIVKVTPDLRQAVVRFRIENVPVAIEQTVSLDITR